MRFYIIVIILLSFAVLLSAVDDISDFEATKKIYDGILLEAKYSEIIGINSESYSGQLALLEVGKLSILKRDYEKAESIFRQIFDERITDKEYWLAKCYLKLEDPTRAIISAQNYICDSSDKSKIESAYFIIVESYIISNKYQRALNTLESLRTSAYIQNYIPLMYYKKGYCQEMLHKYNNATISYKNLKTEYPYHELAFLAEERIYNMQDEEKIDYKVVENPRKAKPVEVQKSGNELKTYLQAGAFGSEKNAKKLGTKISSIGYNYIIFDKMQGGKKLFCVAAGPFDNSSNAQNANLKLKNIQINSYVIKRY